MCVGGSLAIRVSSMFVFCVLVCRLGICSLFYILFL